jgi:hypothetical protein
LKYLLCADYHVARNNGRLRRTIADILFNEGKMTRAAMAERLYEMGMFREVPSESSLAALISKNAQIVSCGHEKVELSNGSIVRNMVFDIDRDLIREESDLIHTRPFSSMTNREKEKAVRCDGCKQMRLMEEGWVKCLPCFRRGV